MWKSSYTLPGYASVIVQFWSIVLLLLVVTDTDENIIFICIISMQIESQMVNFYLFLNFFDINNKDDVLLEFKTIKNSYYFIFLLNNNLVNL